MTQKILFAFIISVVVSSCQEPGDAVSDSSVEELTEWDFEGLNQRASQHLDSSKWDKELFAQDIETYNQYAEIFQSYPLNKSPFPVAEYDYAVSSVPFVIEHDGHIFKGVRIGEYKNPKSEEVVDKLTLLVLTNDKDAEESTLVDSRNHPYLTAQGYFEVSNNKYDWVFAASPDGFSTLVLNMKLFDLRFGETVIIYPQKDRSFLYHQIDDSPNNYDGFEAFEKSLILNESIESQLKSGGNIKGI